MMKWLGLLLVVCSGGGIGFLYAMQLRQERTNLEQLCRETAYAAFQFPVTVLSGMEQGLPLAEAWAAGIRQDKAVPEPAKKLLLPLGEELGASDLDGQAATLAQYRMQLEPYAAEAGEKCVQRQRLYCSLGLLGGLLAAILLC